MNETTGGKTQEAKVYSFMFDNNLRKVVANYSAGTKSTDCPVTITDIINEAVTEWVGKRAEEVRSKVNDQTKLLLEKIV